MVFRPERTGFRPTRLEPAIVESAFLSLANEGRRTTPLFGRASGVTPMVHIVSIARASAARCLVLGSVCLVGACSTNSVGLSYRPTATVVAATANSAAVSVGSFIDQRGESATWFGAIRGGYGSALKTLEATPSVAALVQAAFADGLRARGFQASGGGNGYQVAGVIKKLDCSQYLRREAHVEIEVTVADNATGKQVFSRIYTADNLEGSAMTLSAGVFGSVDALRALAEKTLGEVVDKSLDDTALRNAMR